LEKSIILKFTYCVIHTSHAYVAHVTLSSQVWKEVKSHLWPSRSYICAMLFGKWPIRQHFIVIYC